MPDMEALLDAAQEAYHANLGYRRLNSVAMAYAFAEACDALAALIPSMSSQGSRHLLTMDTNLRSIEKKAEDAYAFAASGAAGAVRHFDVSNFRN